MTKDEVFGRYRAGVERAIILLHQELAEVALGYRKLQDAENQFTRRVDLIQARYDADMRAIAEAEAEDDFPGDVIVIDARKPSHA